MLIFFIVVIFPEDLRLHPSSDQPKRIGDDVAHAPSNPGTYRIQPRLIILPPKIHLYLPFNKFIRRKIYRIKDRYKKYTYRITSIQPWESFSVEKTLEVSKAVLSHAAYLSLYLNPSFQYFKGEDERCGCDRC